MSAVPTPRRAAGMTDAQFGLVIILAVSILNAAIIFAPLGYSLWLSMHDSNVILRTMEFVGFDHYLKAMADAKVQAAAGRTLIFSAISVVLSFVLSLSFALQIQGPLGV